VTREDFFYFYYYYFLMKLISFPTVSIECGTPQRQYWWGNVVVVVSGAGSRIPVHTVFF